MRGKNTKSIHQKNWRNGGPGLPPKIKRTKYVQYGKKKGKIYDNQWLAARKVERLFNHMPRYLRDITGKTTEYFKRELDRWLINEVPDQPKCGDYAGRVAARINSIIDQYLPGIVWIISGKHRRG